MWVHAEHHHHRPGPVLRVRILLHCPGLPHQRTMPWQTGKKGMGRIHHRKGDVAIMKWICTYCASPCLVEVQGISTTNPNACIYKEARAIKPNWKRVDEPEAQATKWVGGRCACTYLPVNPPHLAVVNELEKISSQVKKLENKVGYLESVVDNHTHKPGVRIR